MSAVDDVTRYFQNENCWNFRSSHKKRDNLIERCLNQILPEDSKRTRLELFQNRSQNHFSSQEPKRTAFAKKVRYFLSYRVYPYTWNTHQDILEHPHVSGRFWTYQENFFFATEKLVSYAFWPRILFIFFLVRFRVISWRWKFLVSWWWRKKNSWC